MNNKPRLWYILRKKNWEKLPPLMRDNYIKVSSRLYALQLIFFCRSPQIGTVWKEMSFCNFFVKTGIWLKSIFYFSILYMRKTFSHGIRVIAWAGFKKVLKGFFMIYDFVAKNLIWLNWLEQKLFSSNSFSKAIFHYRKQPF